MRKKRRGRRKIYGDNQNYHPCFIPSSYIWLLHVIIDLVQHLLHLGGILLFACKIYARERKSWARFNFYVQARPSKHCLCFIYARKIYVHTLVKKTRQWKSTLSPLVKRAYNSWHRNQFVTT